jgi:bifunctional DNase/RNase
MRARYTRAMSMKEVELCRLVHSDASPECHMYLRERVPAGTPGGTRGRVFPVIIAMNEMAEIHRKVHGLATRRPMTHDIFAALMKAAHLELVSVEITELKDDVFYAKMNFKTEDGRSFTVDARPSDSVAIATGVGARLFANEKILDDIGVVEEEPAGGSDAGEKEAGGSN